MVNVTTIMTTFDRPIEQKTDNEEEQRRHNSSYKKLAVQCFVWQFCGSTNICASYEHLW